MTSVWVVDDHAVIRQGLKQIPTQETNQFKVTLEASSVNELFDLLSKNEAPGALILDLSMAGKSGLDALDELKTQYPKIPVLILSMHPEDQYAIRSLKAGAAGYLTKECAPEQLVTALSTIVGGEKYITGQVASILASSLNSPKGSSKPHEDLSDREFQILIFIAQGKSLTDIAKNFYLSVKTVSTYRARLLKKMGMKTNAELIQYALINKLLPDTQVNNAG
jgi:two-component system invasion response regulator UvrY